MRAETYPDHPTLLKLLAHEVRWQLVTLLVQSDYKVQELVKRVGRPMNLISYHLRQLRTHQLVVENQSAADARDHYYHLDLEKLRVLYMETGSALHPAFLATSDAQEDLQRSRPLRVLFLCTHNSARSQMAEALLRHMGKGRIEVFSGGTEPSDIHPLALQTMAAKGIDMRGQRSKPMSEFFDQSFDYIVTVCDRARESCPTFPGDPERIHWSFPDPTQEPTQVARERAFEEVARQLTSRISYLLIIMERRARGSL